MSVYSLDRFTYKVVHHDTTINARDQKYVYFYIVSIITFTLFTTISTIL